MLNSEMYAILAMLARYFFAALMVLVVLRAWRITSMDNRRWRWLRERSTQTGCVGELLLNPGTAKKQVSLPIPREGVIGSARKADIRLKCKDVAGMHAHIEEREGGLLARPLGKNRIAVGKGPLTGDPVFAQDGDVLHIGKQDLLIVMFDASVRRVDAVPPPEQPQLRRTKKNRRLNAPPEPNAPLEPDEVLDAPDDYDALFDDKLLDDDFFDEDKLWQDESKPKSTR